MKKSSLEKVRLSSVHAVQFSQHQKFCAKINEGRQKKVIEATIATHEKEVQFLT